MYTIYFTLAFALCVRSSFTVHKRSSNSVHRSLRVRFKWERRTFEGLYNNWNFYVTNLLFSHLSQLRLVISCKTSAFALSVNRFTGEHYINLKFVTKHHRLCLWLSLPTVIQICFFDINIINIELLLNCHFYFVVICMLNEY